MKVSLKLINAIRETNLPEQLQAGSETEFRACILRLLYLVTLRPEYKSVGDARGHIIQQLDHLENTPDVTGHAKFEWPRFSSLRRRSIKRSVVGAFISAARNAGSTRIQELDIEQADLEANPETDRKSSKRPREHDRDDKREAYRRCPPRLPGSSFEPTDIARRYTTQAAGITRLESELERVHQPGTSQQPQQRPSFSRIVGMTDHDQPHQRSASRVSLELFSLAPTCKGITKTGQSCRRPVDARTGNENRAASTSRGTVIDAAAHFCYQNKDQDEGLASDASAVRAIFTMNAPRFDGRFATGGSVGHGRVTLNIAMFEGARTNS